MIKRFTVAALAASLASPLALSARNPIRDSMKGSSTSRGRTSWPRQRS
jgi:hypothetical protein